MTYIIIAVVVALLCAAAGFAYYFLVYRSNFFRKSICMKKNRITCIVGIIAVLLLLIICSKCADKNLQDKTYDSIDRNNIDKVVKKGKIQYSDALTENPERFCLNALISDNMVLQRNAVNCIWGTSEKDGEIAVTINNKTFYGTVESGVFAIYLSPMESGGPYDMVVFDGSEKVTIRNVLIGEVFLLAGQSNMQMRVSDTLTTEELEIFDNDKIRFFEIATNYSEEPLEEMSIYDVITWTASTRDTAMYCSAAGYYFAKELQTRYPDMPIGLVMCCQGATYLSTWIPQYAYDELVNNGFYIPANEADPRLTPALHYNAMVNPIRNFKFKTVLWYQGENQPQNYDKGLEKLIQTWRKELSSPDMGFVVFTLPRLVVDKYSNYAVVDEYAWFESRTLQMIAAQNVDNATYCVANDLGSYDDIHPLDKKVIATRAAHAFISKFYGSTETLTGPRYESYTVNGSSIEITFTNVGSGLELRNKNLGFEIMNENYEYEVAEVEIIENNKIRITGTTDAPKGFRYGYTNVYSTLTEEEQKDVKNAVCLYNKEGYPAEQINVVFE